MVSVREKAGESHSQNPEGDEEYKMAKKNINFVKSVVIIAIGAALYGFGGLLSIPVFTNTYLKPAMAILALFSALWGPVVGALVGFIGHCITDLVYGQIWFSWALGSAIVGALMGLYPYFTKNSLEEGVFGGKQVCIFTVMALVANFVGYMISVLLDVVAYGEPFFKSLAQQQITTVSNTVVIGIIGSALMLLVAKKFSSAISLSEDSNV